MRTLADNVKIYSLLEDIRKYLAGNIIVITAFRSSQLFDAVLSEKLKRYSKKIVGIDAANYEAQCRPEVLASCFRRTRQMVGSERELGVTFHVGEAFDALCSGLRAIDEAVRFMDLRRGDRLGHALALGIDVEAFQKAKRNMVSLSLQDHVDNLALLYHIIAHRGTDSYKRWLGFLHEEFHRNCSRLYDGIVL